MPLTLFVGSLYASLWANEFQPHLPQFRFSEHEQIQYHEIRTHKNAQFADGLEIPFYQIGVRHPWNEGFLYDDLPCTQTRCRFDFEMKPAEAKQLKLLQVAGLGYILVPRSWHQFEAEVASNGSAHFIIQNAEKNQAIDWLNTAQCYGCALTSGNLYFPELQRRLDLEDYGSSSDTHHHLHLVYAKPNTTFFSYQIPKLKNKTHGVAHYTEQHGLNFQKLEVTVTNHQLTRVILNFYNQQLHAEN